MFLGWCALSLLWTGYHPLEGWGWSGLWPGTATPYGWLDFSTRRHSETGLNAFLDVFFQLGLVGFLIFLTLVVLAFWRSWVLASDDEAEHPT